MRHRDGALHHDNQRWFMLLSEYLETRYFVERDLEKSTRLFFLLKIGVFGAFLKRSPTLADLNRDTINRFLVKRLEDRSRETVRGERSVLVALWNDAHNVGLLEHPPSRIKPIKKQLPEPEGWDEGQLRKLVAYAATIDGNLKGKGIERAAYWRAFFLTAYDSGLRLGDLELLRSSMVVGAGTYRVSQHKTKKPVEFSISPVTWEAIKATHPHARKLIFGGVLSRRSFFLRLREIVTGAGLRGRTKMIRKSSGSLFERQYPGEGHTHLGNGRDVFLKHYAVDRLIQKKGRLPPQLENG